MALIFYLVCRQFGDTHQLLIWHKSEIDSAGHLIDAAIRRVVIVLIVAQGLFLLRHIGEYKFYSLMSIVGLIILTSMFLGLSPIITPSAHADTILPPGDLHSDLVEWWNMYKHPLTAEAKTSSTGHNDALYLSTVHSPLKQRSNQMRGIDVPRVYLSDEGEGDSSVDSFMSPSFKPSGRKPDPTPSSSGFKEIEKNKAFAKSLLGSSIHLKSPLHYKHA